MNCCWQQLLAVDCGRIVAKTGLALAGYATPAQLAYHAAFAFVSLRRDKTEFIPKFILGSNVKLWFYLEDDAQIPKTLNSGALL